MPTIVNGLAFGEVLFSGEFGKIGVFGLGWPGEVLEDIFTAAGSFFPGEFVRVFLARVAEDGVVIDFFFLIPGSLSFFLLSLSIKTFSWVLFAP